MKTKLILATVFVLFLSLGIMGCDDGKEGRNVSAFGMASFKNLECKKNANGEQKEYLHFTSENNYLFVNHLNVKLNCCLEEVVVNFQIERNKTIIINERDKNQSCNCFCEYDLDYKIGTLDYGKYHIILKKNGETVSEFDVNFNAETNEKIVVK